LIPGETVTADYDSKVVEVYCYLSALYQSRSKHAHVTQVCMLGAVSRRRSQMALLDLLEVQQHYLRGTALPCRLLPITCLPDHTRVLLQERLPGQRTGRPCCLVCCPNKEKALLGPCVRWHPSHHMGQRRNKEQCVPTHYPTQYLFLAPRVAVLRLEPPDCGVPGAHPGFCTARRSPVAMRWCHWAAVLQAHRSGYSCAAVWQPTRIPVPLSR
jgi:hypothetical protein